MQEVFEVIKKNRKYKSIFDDLEISKTIKRNWSSIFGKLAGDLSFGYCKNGFLFIETRNQIWVNEIDFYKKDILVKLNNLFTRKKIKNIRVKWSSFKKDLYLEKKTNQKKQTHGHLEEKVKNKIKTKQKEGFLWCKNCQSVLTKDEQCVFCEAFKLLNKLQGDI
jgi:hypothetical protein